MGGFGDKPPGNPEPVGRALVAQLGPEVLQDVGEPLAAIRTARFVASM